MHLDGDSYALESRAAHSLTIQAFHAICFFLLSRPHIITPVDAEVHLGSVFRRVWHSDRETWLYTEISRLPSAHFHARNLWRHGFTGETLPSGILRFQVNLRPDTSILLRASSTPLMYPAWLSQAQYIFQRLDITSDYDQYVCAECLQLSVDIPAAANRDGAYLFVCPPLDLSAAPISDLRRLFSWYWSLDPDGTNSFTEEEASEQGFPAVSLELRLFGCSWDEGVYAGLGKFHAAKGFDVESQDIALRLGYPLYEPLGNAEFPPSPLLTKPPRSTIRQENWKSHEPGGSWTQSK
ncbi:hypothetical protein FB45DRAFT_60728 [Roridomyces roridus]|uniref:Uncharacterized protein n=1 Tax=Roridomyces roridus TaxID=1738132 RepID=A0AAD7FJB3_9AGAR|nr:hypothetical protein FB45DRAFT_60728 [Roridomyces roridus]